MILVTPPIASPHSWAPDTAPPPACTFAPELAMLWGSHTPECAPPCTLLAAFSSSWPSPQHVFFQGQSPV